MSTNSDHKTPSELAAEEALRRVMKLREAEKERLSQLPTFGKSAADEVGVLLSDRIRHYCTAYRLIDPFKEDLLKPAGYELTVGQHYSIRGDRKALSDGLTLQIEPYQV